MANILDIEHRIVVLFNRKDVAIAVVIFTEAVAWETALRKT